MPAFIIKRYTCFVVYYISYTYLNITFSLIINSMENKLPNNRFIRTKKKAPILLKGRIHIKYNSPDT